MDEKENFFCLKKNFLMIVFIEKVSYSQREHYGISG